MLKRRKKGFTLAELLIVVAIIAVLVAIAVPLFVSGLQKAQKARDDANIRSVKSAAVVYILNHDTNETDTTNFKLYVTDDEAEGDETLTAGDLYSYFSVEATIAPGGKITINKITGSKDAPAESDETKEITKSGDNWIVKTQIDTLDFEAVSGD